MRSLRLFITTSLHSKTSIKAIITINSSKQHNQHTAGGAISSGLRVLDCVCDWLVSGWTGALNVGTEKRKNRN